jgi:transmembrane sensor
MKARPQDPAPEIIEAAAAAWLSLRDRGMSSAETTEFVRWLQQDERHATVFGELDRTWKDLDRLSVVPAADAEPCGDLLAPRIRSRRPRVLGWTALAAAAAVAILLVTFQLRAIRHTAETTIGAFQKLDLPDGSIAQLNTDSAIDVDFTAAERRVRVARGEVFFTVEKNADRPFIVSAGPVAVRAVGTAFNVRQHDAAVEVLVTEGRVRVEDTRQGHSLLPQPEAGASDRPVLAAGERAWVPIGAGRRDAAPSAATVETISASDAHRALAWQERRLEFDAKPLAEVVREFNRYNQRRLVIADSTLAAKRFSGTFRADSYEAFVRLLEQDFAVEAVRGEREIVLRARR